MNLEMFKNPDMGSLVPIAGTDRELGEWSHRAFMPVPLPDTCPVLSPATYLTIANARASLAALDNTAKQLPNPELLRNPSLRREAQSTSALEGTYAPLESVLMADEEDLRSVQGETAEVMNYVRMADQGFRHVAEGRAISVAFLSACQGELMRGTSLEAESGRVRESQVVIGRRPDAPLGGFPVHAARFIPPPPGGDLERALRDLTDWMQTDHSGRIDPVVTAAMAHYQFEALHPFRDGNGRLGRFLIVVQLLHDRVLSEPTLTVSPWFEARRAEYYDRLLAVSSDGDWDGFVGFFAQGLQAAADETHRQMVTMVTIQNELKEQIRASHLRADSAHVIVDLAIANPGFTIKMAEQAIGLSYQRAGRVVGALVEIGVLKKLPHKIGNRHVFYAPRVLKVLVEGL